MFESSHTTFIFAVGEVDPKSSGREERQKEGQTSALLWGLTSASLRWLPFPGEETRTSEPLGQVTRSWRSRCSERMRLWWETNVQWSTSSCFSSSCCWAVAGCCSSLRFAFRLLLLLPAAGIYVRLHICPRVHPSCMLTKIKKKPYLIIQLRE